MTDLDEAEKKIIEAIEFHRREYERATKPYFDQLVRIRSLRTAPSMFVMADCDRFCDAVCLNVPDCA